MPIQSVNDFVIRFANVNGSGSASANELFARSVLRIGIPVAPRNIFPSNIQGLPTWYEVRISEAGYHGARGGTDFMVAMNPHTWDKDVAGIEPGGYLLYDSTKPMPKSKFHVARLRVAPPSARSLPLMPKKPEHVPEHAPKQLDGDDCRGPDACRFKRPHNLDWDRHTRRFGTSGHARRRESGSQARDCRGRDSREAGHKAAPQGPRISELLPARRDHRKHPPHAAISVVAHQAI